MKYEKPQVAVLATAAKAVQSGNKTIHLVQDANFPRVTALSDGAYEADE